MTTKKRYIVTLGSEEPLAVELEYNSEDGCWWANVDGERLALNLRGIDASGQVEAEIGPLA